MVPIISIEFMYREKQYSALVRIKDKQSFTEYHVTIMNGALEQKLYGHHIFVEEDGEFVIGPIPEKEAGELRLTVGMALCRHYNKPYSSRQKTA